MVHIDIYYSARIRSGSQFVSFPPLFHTLLFPLPFPSRDKYRSILLAPCVFAVNSVRSEPKSVASDGKGNLFSQSLFHVQKIFKQVTGEISGLERRMCQTVTKV